MTKLHHLQALRGVAANLVVLDHGFSAMIKYGAVPAHFQAASWHLGEMGVTMFFVISGFIMTYTSYDAMGKAGAPYLFLEKRIIRVVPLYWVATLLAFILFFIAGRPDGVGNLVKSLLFIPYYADGSADIRPVLGQGWTINYEIFFYLIFALALLMKPAKAFYFLIAAFLLFVGVGFSLDAQGLHAGAIAEAWTDPIILYFLIGALLGWVRVRTSVEVGIGRPLALAFAMILLSEGIFYLTGGSWAAAIICPILSIIAVIACTFSPDGSDGIVHKISELLGDGSYSTYLFHTFILAVLNRLILGHADASMTLYLVLALLGANLGGVAMYLGLERPVTNVLRNAIHARRRMALMASVET